jgi:hypothetical protein
MKHNRSDRRSDERDSIEAELRGAYERGRRDQRGRPGGSSLIVLLLIGSTLALALLFVTMVRPTDLNFGPHAADAQTAAVPDPSAQPANAPANASDALSSDSRPNRLTTVTN